MKKVKDIVYLETEEERGGPFSKGIKFIFEDGSELEQMTTDPVADKFMPRCIVCKSLGHKTCDNFPI